MEEKVDSEQSYSGESSSSSSESSSGTSDSDEEVLEPVRILGQTLELPQDLCENPEIFKEFFSMKAWECLDEEDKEHLKQFLPDFPEDDDAEKETTVKMLLEHEPFHFISPLQQFHKNLRQGNFRPDIAKMRKFLRKARAKQQKHKRKSYYAKLLPEVLLSRERVLAAAKAAPPGPIPYIPPLPPKQTSRNNYKPIYLRARQRYFEELNAICSEVGGEESEDDNYPEGPLEFSYKKRKQANSVQNADSGVSGTLGGGEPSHLKSLECLKNVLAIHRARRQYRENHPELNVAGITLDDIKQRVALINGTKKLMFGGPKTETPIQKLRKGTKREVYSKQSKSDMKGGKKSKEDLESVENKPLLPNIKIKCEQEESDSENSSFLDPVTSPKQHKKPPDNIEIKKEVDTSYSNIPNTNYNETELDTVIKQEPPDPSNPISTSGKTCQPVPIKLEDLDGIDMMALPVELVDDTGEVLPGDTSTETDEPTAEADEPLTETTHANFLSLVRALFPARAAHRASKQQLHARCAAVMRSPIAPLNTWYSLSNDWCGELDSALDFLAGERGPHPEDFVPYLQYMPENQMYQWIGAGRDCDALLGRLCERWLRAAAPRLTPRAPRDVRGPPSPWIVRPATNSELADFRAQERKRFSTSTKPFTYVQHGFRFVVGPAIGGGGAGAGPGGALLAAHRPRAAAFPALVRDALARLPHGEGTRKDVLTLLKMSQWILPCSDQTLNGALSLTLEKLLSIKRDPIVKFDLRSSIWTYLHRNRSEEDWLKCTRRGKAAPRAMHSPPEPMDMDVANMDDVMDITEVSDSMDVAENNASDSDVDVDDVPSAPPQLSSAQLLRQATAGHAKHPPPPKPKGKLVPTPQKPKTKVPPAKITTVIQSAKQTSPSGAKQSPSGKQTVVTPQTSVIAQTKQVTPQMVKRVAQGTPSSLTGKQPAQGGKQSVTPQAAKQCSVIQSQSVTVPQGVPSPKKTAQLSKPNVPVAKQVNIPPLVKQTTDSVITIAKSLPSVVVPPQKSPLNKQKTMVKPETSQALSNAVSAASHIVAPVPSVIQPSVSMSVHPAQPKLTQVTRSLLIKPPTVQTTCAPAMVTAVVSPPTTQPSTTTNIRRGVVRVLSPATPSSGKSLISPRALMQQTCATTTKKRPLVPNTTSVTTVAQFPSLQSSVNTTAVVSSQPTVVSSSVATRTVQLAGGRTVQLAGNQTVHLPGGQAVQLSSGHTLQLSSLQPTHSVRLPSGQTVQLASPQTVQAVRAVSTMQVKNPSPRPQSSPTIKPVIQSSGQQSTVQIPVSTVQLAGQTVQIAGQTVQLAGQSVQLTGHTVKLPSGQSVQVASQSVMPSQSVQLGGQTVQLASGNVQAVQLAGQNVQLSGQSVQMQSGQSVQLGTQTVQIGGQTVQLAGGQTVQLPGGQTLQLSGGQTVQLPNGQTIQLASGQALQLANQTPKSIAQVVRAQSTGDKTTQPIVAKLLTNAQGQMISLEGVVGARGRGGVRVVSPAARLARPLLLTSAKPLHNIILQSDGGAIRVTSSGGASTSQTIVLSNIGGQTATTSTASAPVLKLQQVNPTHQVKLPQGIKLQQAVTNASVPTSSGVRSVLMDGQQLKLVGGRHVLARLLRPAHPPP
ncbi:uncharacterized protein [Epargyreus clarus]|uniref:uncharacterized protein isoform X2 n=1 Tax=Epargyreus clarus TaxID=520877 RepID=UPI003C2E5640